MNLDDSGAGLESHIEYRLGGVDGVPLENGAIKDLRCFSLKEIGKSLNDINVVINGKHNRPFPKNRDRFLSHYRYEQRKIRITSTGEIEGGAVRLVLSLIDLSFVRSLVGDAYDRRGGKCYDPVSLVVLEIIKWIEKVETYTEFCRRLRDSRGQQARLYAGVYAPNIPSHKTFSDVRFQIGEARYNAILHVLIDIISALGMITGKFIAYDGCLFPSFARYKGCAYTCEECASMNVKDLRGKVRSRLIEMLNKPRKLEVGHELRIRIHCPREDLHEEANPPMSEVVRLVIEHAGYEVPEEEHTDEQLPPARESRGPEAALSWLGLEDLFKERCLRVRAVSSNIISLGPGNDGAISCPKLPKDEDASVGHRKSKRDPSKVEAVFGYNSVRASSYEPLLRTQFPVGCITETGGIYEGNYFKNIRGQVTTNHPYFRIILDTADAHFDDIKNYEYIRADNSIPVIRYNPRSEDLSLEKQRQRGFDVNGRPFAPCGAVMTRNGYDYDKKRQTAACMNICLRHPELAPGAVPACRHGTGPTGCVRHMSIKAHPRIVTEIPRGTPRFRHAFNMRTAAERVNEDCEEISAAARHMRARSKRSAGIAQQLVTIAALLVTFARTIARVTSSLLKLEKTKDEKERQKIEKTLRLRQIPKWLLNIVQRK